jgi:NAD(P)-dependent dehydrogenase (short-subunit alcohol dehydrogenase family)
MGNGPLDDLNGKVAVVTGGAAGIGRGLAEALLEEGTRVVLADIEEPVLQVAVKELSDTGEVRGVVTDVSSPHSVEELAADVFSREGACHLLFNNAGVTSGGGGRPWEQEPNDWTWCFNVNVFGVANGILSFVPRMIDSGEPGVVVNTSSMDGGIAPVPYASVYASSKAAISCLTEALAHQLAAAGTDVRAAVFYPSGGLLDTGLWTAQRNRPAALARTRPRPAAPGTTFEEFKEQLQASGRPVDVMDPRELGRFCLQGLKRGDFVIGHGLDESAALLRRRADAIEQGRLPPPALS